MAAPKINSANKSVLFNLREDGCCSSKSYSFSADKRIICRGKISDVTFYADQKCGKSCSVVFTSNMMRDQTKMLVRKIGEKVSCVLNIFRYLNNVIILVTGVETNTL